VHKTKKLRKKLKNVVSKIDADTVIISGSALISDKPNGSFKAARK